MAGFFQVDLDALREFADALRQSEEHLQTAMKAMATASGGDVGGAALDQAANEFQSAWHYGVRQLGTVVKGAAEGVSAAHTAYQQVEDDAGKTLRELRQPLG